MDHERDPAGCVSRNVVAEIEGIEYPDEVSIRCYLLSRIIYYFIHS